ncbi:MAG: MBL fold metallo-hydrolase [Deltaproteobacteria bacterium]|nr:MBL fold metallo-hydrolase [Deltaproteobacteria bacterium]
MSLDKVLVTQMLVGPDRVFSYLVSCPASRAAVLIDPGGDPEKILDAVSLKRLDVRYILCTHGHADHLYAAAALREELGAMVCMHEADAAFFGKEGSGGAGSPFPHIDVRLKEGLILSFGRRDALVIHTPGHTIPPVIRPDPSVFWWEGTCSPGTPSSWALPDVPTLPGDPWMNCLIPSEKNCYPSPTTPSSGRATTMEKPPFPLWPAKDVKTST